MINAHYILKMVRNEPFPTEIIHLLKQKKTTPFRTLTFTGCTFHQVVQSLSLWQEFRFLYHSSLKWIMTFKELEGQLARWLYTLSKYDFEIRYRAGKNTRKCRRAFEN